MFFAEKTNCCSLDITIALDNAFVSCSTIVSCVAECYRGYIFPSGSTKESYICQNGVWTPTLSSCKRTSFFFWFCDWIYVHICWRVPMNLIYLYFSDVLSSVEAIWLMCLHILILFMLNFNIIKITLYVEEDL